MTALLDHLWQSSLFALAAGLLTLALSANAARIRFWLWFVYNQPEKGEES